MTNSKESAAYFGNFGDLIKFISNSVSFAILACTGILINVLLAHYFNASAVGEFNLLVTLYLVIGQVAAFGIHLSCLYYLGKDEVFSPAWNICARKALHSVVITGALTCCLLLCLSYLTTYKYSPSTIGMGLFWLAPTVMLFGANKVLIAIFNIADRLHSLAFVQALRPVTWLVALSTFIKYQEVNMGLFGQLLLMGELSTLIACILLLLDVFRRQTKTSPPIKAIETNRSWIKTHLYFGLRALPSYLLIELNTRIDILVLALFASEAIVGVYSFIALLAEGIFQIGVLTRTVITRRLTQILLTKNQNALSLLKSKAGQWNCLVTASAALVLVLSYKPLIQILNLDSSLQQGYLSLCILIAGVIICSKSSPFWMTLTLAGKPGTHSTLMIILCGFNLLLNVILIPILGLMGAAISMALMFAVFPFLLAWAVKQNLGIKL